MKNHHPAQDSFQKWILLGTGISIVAAVGLFVTSPELSQMVDKGMVEATYQFFLVVVTGGAVSYFYREFTRERDRKEAERRELIHLYDDLVETYNSYKEVKRLLRALARREITEDGRKKDVLLIPEYIPLLKQLNKIQLRFEAFKRAPVASNSLVKLSEGKKLKEALEVVEKHINAIIKEFETAMYKRTDEEYIELSRLESTRGFISSSDLDTNGSEKYKARGKFEEILELLNQKTSLNS